MVSYAYQSLFYKAHQKKDILIVDADATVTTSSGQAPTVSGAMYEIQTEDLVINSLSLDESLCSEDNLRFGLCESSKLSFTIRNTSTISNMKTADPILFNVYLYFNGDSSTLFQLGQYVCAKDEYTINRKQREVEFYDILYLLWDYDITDWYSTTYASGNSVSIKNLRDSLFTWIAQDIDLAITQETTTLVNDNLTIGKTIESDVITFGFFMQGLLEINGVFGHINRTGQFVYISLDSYDKTSVAKVTDDFRKPPTQYKDYTVQGIAFVIAYDKNNLQMGKVGSTNMAIPSIYSVNNNFAIDGMNKNILTFAALGMILGNMRNKVTHLRYKPATVECVGNPCIEVGDKIDVEYDKNGDGITETFYTFVLERHMQGLGQIVDTYTSKGEVRQPNNQMTENWHIGESSGESTSGSATGGISTVSDSTINDFCEIIRNIGFRVLDVPSGVEAEYDDDLMVAKFKWTDPDDISTTEPDTGTWAGTVVVRKEGSAPKHRWDGDLIVDSTTRDAYKNTWLEDNTIQPNKKYYYGIFPYHIKDGKGWYNPTMVVTVDTADFLVAPTITSVRTAGASTWDGSETDIMWSGESNKLTVQVASNQIVFKMYTGASEIYSFTSPIGSAPTDVENIYVSFIVDETNQVAKPSFIYYSGSTYSYNQESPTDAEMGDIYTWLSAGLPSE